MFELLVCIGNDVCVCLGTGYGLDVCVWADIDVLVGTVLLVLMSVLRLVHGQCFFVVCFCVCICVCVSVDIYVVINYVLVLTSP